MDACRCWGGYQSLGLRPQRPNACRAIALKPHAHHAHPSWVRFSLLHQLLAAKRNPLVSQSFRYAAESPSRLVSECGVGSFAGLGSSPVQCGRAAIPQGSCLNPTSPPFERVQSVLDTGASPPFCGAYRENIQATAAAQLAHSSGRCASTSALTTASLGGVVCMPLLCYPARLHRLSS